MRATTAFVFLPTPTRAGLIPSDFFHDYLAPDFLETEPSVFMQRLRMQGVARELGLTRRSPSAGRSSARYNGREIPPTGCTRS
jgi:hypothetical protein